MLYTYTAVDKEGKTVSGEQEADSEAGLVGILRRESVFLVSASAGQKRKSIAPSFISMVNRWRGVSRVERMMFARNLAVMLGAGLPLSRALSALEEQIDRAVFKRVIAEIRKSIVKGQNFSEALTPHEKVFGPLFIHMVAAGEVSGKLEYVLSLTARQLARDYTLRAKVKGAMTYPLIVIAALFIIGALMMYYIVPVLTVTFRELGVPLPFATRFIIGISELFTKYLLLILGMIPVAWYAAWRFLGTSLGGRWRGTAALRMPIFGSLVKKFNAARFARILSALLSSGIPIARSLEITAGVIGNIFFRKSLQYAMEEIQKGRPLSSILKESSDLYPPLVTQMLEVGEETGTMSRMLLRLALFYESEVSGATKNLSSIIEPLLMVVIGAFVGLFAVSMIQPIYSSIGGL